MPVIIDQTEKRGEVELTIDIVAHYKFDKAKHLMNMSDVESEDIDSISENAIEELPIELNREILVAILEEASNQLFILKKIGEWPDIFEATVRYKSIHERFQENTYQPLTIEDIEEKSKDDLKNKCSFIVERIDMLRREIKENGRYDDFEDMLQIFHQMQHDEEDLIENTKYKETRVVQLQEILEKEMRILTGQISEYMQKIGSIKDNIEEFTSEADMKMRYITDLKNAEQDMTEKYLSDKQDELLQKIKTTEGNIMKEIRVHEETIIYFNLIQKELEDTLNSWKLRYTKMMSCLNKKIKVETDKVDSLVGEIKRMKELYAKRQKEISDYKAYKQQQEEKRLLKKKMDDAATKIQAWWRGTMVRKGFGKFRKKKDKKGKKNKSKK